MRLWCEVDRKFIEANVLWNGVGPTPAEVRSREHWRQKFVLQVSTVGKERGTLPAAEDGRGKANADKPFNGRKAKKAVVAKDTEPRWQGPRDIYNHPMSTAEQKSGHKLCYTCRTRRAKGRRKTEQAA